MKRFLKTADDSSQSETRTTHPSFSGRLSWLKKASWGLSVSLRILLSRCGFYNFEFDKKKKNNNPETVAHVRRATGHLHPLYSGGNRNVRRTYLNLQNVKPAILMAGWENIIFWADPLKVLWFYSCCQKYFHPPETICAGEICSAWIICLTLFLCWQQFTGRTGFTRQAGRAFPSSNQKEACDRFCKLPALSQLSS